MSLDPSPPKRGKMYLAGLGLSFGVEIAAAAGLGWWAGSALDSYFGFKALFKLLLMFGFFGLSFFHILMVFKRLSAKE